VFEGFEAAIQLQNGSTLFQQISALSEAWMERSIKGQSKVSAARNFDFGNDATKYDGSFDK